MSPEQIEQIIIDERDALIDEWAYSGCDDDYPLPKETSFSITLRNREECCAVLELCFEVIEQQKRVFVHAEEFAQSTNALVASYKVAAMRDLLRQLMLAYHSK